MWHMKTAVPMVVGALATIKKGIIKNIKKVPERATMRFERSACWNLHQSSDRCSVYKQIN